MGVATTAILKYRADCGFWVIIYGFWLMAYGILLGGEGGNADRQTYVAYIRHFRFGCRGEPRQQVGARVVFQLGGGSCK